VPRLCELYPGVCLKTEEKARKNLSQSRKTSVTVGKNLSQGRDLEVGRPERKKPIVRPRLRWEDNIKKDLRKWDGKA
jgi:hypothetical protein